jgi:hypothetical protein
MYPDKSSQMVAVHLVFTALGVPSSKPWQIVMKIDIKGAIVQILMKGEPVHLRIDPKISKYVICIFPDLKDKMGDNVCLYTVLLKAMCGYVQASAMWYSLIRIFLEELGYECSETDRCVLRKIKGGRIFILLLHVDDILVMVDAKEAKRLKEHLTKRFRTVQFEVCRLTCKSDASQAGLGTTQTYRVRKFSVRNRSGP